MTGATAPGCNSRLIAARVLLPGAAGRGYAARLDRLDVASTSAAFPPPPLTLTTEAPVASRATAPLRPRVPSPWARPRTRP